MKQPERHDHAQLQAALLSCEERRTKLFTSFESEGFGGEWLCYFQSLSVNEQNSDRAYRQLIAQTQNRAQQIQVEQEWLSAISQDIAWYQPLRSQLSQTRRIWEEMGDHSEHNHRSLDMHLSAMQRRVTERRVAQYQVMLEVIERDNLSSEYNHERWLETWRLLQSLWVEHEQHYDIVPPEIRRERLHWLRQMDALQKQLAKKRALLPHAARASFNARRRAVRQEINSLSFLPTIRQALLAVGLSAFLVWLVLALALGNSETLIIEPALFAFNGM